jgi:nucleoid DNA-binding protein
MNKQQLVESLADKSGVYRKQAEAVLEALGEAVQEALAAGEEVTLPGVGKFKPAVRPARQQRNPKTGEAMQVPEKTVVKFVQAKKLKDAAAGAAQA